MKLSGKDPFHEFQRQRSEIPDQDIINEQRLETILSQINAGIAVTDLGGIFMEVNSRYCEITGYSMEELKEKTIMDITHPDDVQRNIPLLRRCIEYGENFFLEKRYIRKDGDEVWVKNSVSMIIGSNGEKVLTAVSIDITHQKMAEKALRDSEERYQNFIRRSTEGIWRFEADQPISIELPVSDQLDLFFSSAWLAECNDATARMYGYEKAEEITGLRLHQFFPRDEEAEAYFTHFIQSGYQLQDVESKELDKDGNTKYFRNNLIGIVQNGMLVRCWGTQRDITVQKEVEAKLMDNERDLELLVSMRTAELKRSNEALQQFAHVASHDLKEPVRKFKIYAARLKDEYGDALPERAQEYFAKIQSASTRMSAMIEGVLHYSHLEAQHIDRQQADLNRIIADIRTDLEIVIEDKKAVIETDLLPVVGGAPILLYQLFYNLINNSLKFCRTGVAPFIRITHSLEGDFHVLKVTDNGIGIASDQRESIFEPFVRLNSKDLYDGTGLGLSLCKSIADRHGGSITASGDGKFGASFIVTLPAETVLDMPAAIKKAVKH